MKNNNLCLNNRLLLYFQVQDESNKNHSEKDNPNDTIGEGRMYERLEDPMCQIIFKVCFQATPRQYGILATTE